MAMFIEVVKAYKIGDTLFGDKQEAIEYLNDFDVEVTFEGMGDWLIYKNYYPGALEDDDFEDDSIPWQSFYNNKVEARTQMEKMYDLFSKNDIKIDIIKNNYTFVKLSGCYKDVMKTLSSLDQNYYTDSVAYYFSYDQDIDKQFNLKRNNNF